MYVTSVQVVADDLSITADANVLHQALQDRNMVDFCEQKIHAGRQSVTVCIENKFNFLYS